MNSKIFCLKTYAIGCTVAVLAGFSPAMAIDASNSTSASERGDSGTQLEELVVTARKRDETLLSVPVAVTVLTQADIVRYDASDLTSISQLAPNLMIAQTSATAGAELTIRGIGSSGQDAGIDASVSVILDGAPITRGRIITASMFDLQSVQVLAGPQALFFGKNASAGVVSLTSAGPTATLEGAVKAGYEYKTDERYVEAFAAGPITDAWKFRVAVRSSQSDGFIRNVSIAQPTPAAFGGADFPTPGASDRTEGTTQDLSGRITLEFSPGGPFDGTLKLMEGRYRGNSDNGNSEVVCKPGATNDIYGVPDPTGSCGPKPTFTVSKGDMNPQEAATLPGANGGVPYTNTSLFVGSAALNYRVGKITASSLTGYSDLNYSGFENYDWTTFAQITSAQFERNRDLSEEIRISSDWDLPVNFVVGGYYQHFKRLVHNNTQFLNVGPDPEGRFYSFGETGPQNGTTESGFAQLRWDIVKNLELDAGARFTHDTKDTVIENTYVNPIVAPILGFKPAGQSLGGTYEGNNTSPEVTLTWHPERGQMFYAAYKEGYKSGGFAKPGSLTTSYTLDSIRFKPEVAKGEEVGYKAELLDRSMRIEVTAFKYTYTNLQVVAYDATTFAFNIQNSGAAETKGVETNMEWHVITPLTLRSALYYDRARYITFTTAQCYSSQTVSASPNVAGTCYNGVQDLSGRPTTRAPGWSGNVGGTYEMPISAGLRARLDIDGNYTGGYYPESTEDPFLYQRSYWLLNAGLRLGSAEEKWEVGVFAKNLTDHVYFTSAGQAPGGNPGAYYVLDALPRTVQLQGTYHF